MKSARTVLLILAVSGCTFGRGQIIPFDNYYVQNGLPSNVIYDIEQDRKGYLWLATQVGVVRFDGYNFTTMTTEDGMPDNNISDIFIDSRQRIWVATENGGLAVIEGKSIRQITEADGLVSNYSKKVFEDRTGNIWYVSYNGISRIVAETIENFGAADGITGEVYAMYVAKDSSVWFSTFEKTFVYNKNGLRGFDLPILDESIVRSIAEDSPGSYWFATQEKGVIHLVDSVIKVFDRSKELRSNLCLSVNAVKPGEVLVSTVGPGSIVKIREDRIVRTWTAGLDNIVITGIVPDRRGRYWAQTLENGVFVFSDQYMHQIDESNSLRDNQPTKIFEDHSGNIWIATFNGLSKYGKVIFEQYTHGLLNNDNNIHSIAYADNKVYAGSYSGLNIVADKKIKPVVINPDGIPEDPDVLSILPAGSNEIWLGTYNGLTKFQDHKTQHFYDQLFTLNNSKECVLDMKIYNDTIWCATAFGLVAFSNGQYTRYSITDGLPDNNIWAVDIDESGNIWCATVAGLSVFDGVKFHNYSSREGLANDYCNDIALDPAGSAYLATDNGLSVITLDDSWKMECRNLTKADGLGSEILFSVIIDKRGYIWVGHNRGIDRIDTRSDAIINYGQKEGFLPVETSLGAATLADGEDIWFGTVDGLVRYIPAEDFIYPDPPKLHITGISFLDDTTSVMKYAQGQNSSNLPIDLKLKYNRNNLVFDFVGIHYTIIGKNQYKYMLDGYDDDWSAPSHQITASYRKVPPGNYIFKVMAANCDGVWTEVPAEYSFAVMPPFWKTKLFYAFEFILTLSLLIGFIRLRESKLRHDKEELAKKVKERTIEVETQRDLLALQKKEITDSIVYAERIQEAVLPATDFIESILDEYFIFFQPRNIVSGDFYWLSGDKNNAVVVAADCTGHGVPGAFMSMLGITILNEIVSSGKSQPAGKILDTLRDHLTSTLWQSGKEEDAKDGMDLVLCIIDRTQKQVQFAGAYNPLILIREKELVIYKGDKMPVGYHPGDMPPFTTYAFDYQKGDCLYMFSDGYADQFGGKEGKKFMSKNLRDLLLEVSSLPMSQQKFRLNETIQNWMGINEQVDDILVIGIRIT
jgi:ligand-binding sensor domain-containing protein/serine phosphatase RsbU (regulator of sigma subunit)